MPLAMAAAFRALLLPMPRAENQDEVIGMPGPSHREARTRPGSIVPVFLESRSFPNEPSDCERQWCKG